MRIALGIEYNGTNYFGWQRQREVKSVQEELEKALSIVANHPVEVQCAGRTDAGVHGTGQVVHFDTNVNRKMVAWTMAQMRTCQVTSLFAGQKKFLMTSMRDSQQQRVVTATSFLITHCAQAF